LYGQSLDTAYAIDDTGAVVDALYNQAVSLALAEDSQGALSGVSAARDELVRAGRPIPNELALLQATLAYREGDYDTARDITDRLVRAATGSVAEPAWFLRGLLAHDRKDRAVLDTSITMLSSRGNTDLQPDILELRGYRLEAGGDWNGAAKSFDQASRIRKESGDYRGMVRSLVAAAAALEHSGQDRQAAGYYLRAGRSAAERGATDQAKIWLRRAAELGAKTGDAALAHEARNRLEELD
jgi:tetratricopeptide (TPR) repeat protein